MRWMEIGRRRDSGSGAKQDDIEWDRLLTIFSISSEIQHLIPHSSASVRIHPYCDIPSESHVTFDKLRIPSPPQREKRCEQGKRNETTGVLQIGMQRRWNDIWRRQRRFGGSTDVDRSKVSGWWVVWRRSEHGLEKRKRTSVEDAGCIRNVEPLMAYEQLSHA